MTATASTEVLETRTREQRFFGFVLMGVAGWCDATGFLLFAGIYVSFMSGDATQLGVNIGHGTWLAALQLFAVQAIFVLGVAAGRYYRLERPYRGRRDVLAANVVLLGASALIGNSLSGVPSFVLAVTAMGLQNAIITQEAGVPIGTMITGTLARLGMNLADRIRGEPSDMTDNFAQWACFVVGALGGTIATKLLGPGSFWVPAAVSASLIPLARRLPRMITASQGRLS